MTRIPMHALAALAVLVLASLVAHSLEVDAIAMLEYVIDGDTIRVRIVQVCGEGYEWLLGWEGRVRFADINAPELSTPEGLAAKAFLESLLAGTGIVYLDVDDIRHFDKYGRIVAVAMIDYNETHLLVLNAYMVIAGHAEYRDYPNEFRPPLPLYVGRSILASCTAPGETGGGAATTRTVTVTKTVTRVFTEYVPVTVYGYRVERVTIHKWATVTLRETRTVTITSTLTYPVTSFVTLYATTVEASPVLHIAPILLAAVASAAIAWYLARRVH